MSNKTTAIITIFFNSIQSKQKVGQSYTSIFEKQKSGAHCTPLSIFQFIILNDNEILQSVLKFFSN